MKIAYIITAYTDSKQLRRLIDSLWLNAELDSADFYIHVDKKVNIKPFEEAMKNVSNIFWVMNRYWINWGGFNQVLSQYELLRMIFEESNKVYDRVICLSATDYPLWSNKRIVETMSSDVEFVGGVKVTKESFKNQQRKFTDYHFFRDLEMPLRIKRAICAFSRLLMRYSPFHKSLTFKGDTGKEYCVYTGSDYWGITYKCAKMVFETMKTDRKLMNYFKTSYIPSENVVNTIVMNSPYKERCSHYVENLPSCSLDALTPLHYIVYKDSIKVYQLQDWEELMATDRMFFRKALTGVSDSLVNRLEKEVRNA